MDLLSCQPHGAWNGTQIRARNQTGHAQAAHKTSTPGNSSSMVLLYQEVSYSYRPKANNTSCTHMVHNRWILKGITKSCKVAIPTFTIPRNGVCTVQHHNAIARSHKGSLLQH
jgi:hypothetical protein